MAEKSSRPDDESNSHDSTDYCLDGLGDTTVRPIPPERIEQGKALRAKIQAAEAAGFEYGVEDFYLG